MKSIIIADIFISGVPYLITDFFQGILKEVFLWVNLSLLLSYVYSFARGWRLHTQLASQQHTACHPCQVLCLFQKGSGEELQQVKVLGIKHLKQGQKKDRLSKKCLHIVECNLSSRGTNNGYMINNLFELCAMSSILPSLYLLLHFVLFCLSPFSVSASSVD